MTKLKGKLNWNEEKGYYMTLNTEHYSQNVYIEEDLNENLMDNIKIKVTALNRILFDEFGVLEKRNDLGGNIWRFWVGDKCLDDILFSLTQRKVEIEYKIFEK